MRQYFRLRFVLLLLFVVTGISALAMEVPFLSGRINDTAHLLSQETVMDLERMLRAYEDSTTNQIVLLTITSLEGESLEEYSHRVAETWKLGKKGVDNGVLLLVSEKDRKLRIEVGYGLEASVTDALSNGIINNIITPHFKQGDYDTGIREGLIALMQAADGRLSADTFQAAQDEDFSLLLFLLFWFGIVGLFTVFAVFQEGVGGWFLYAFLIPFYTAPAFLIYEFAGSMLGILIFLLYVVGTPLLRIFMPKTELGKRIAKRIKSSTHTTWSVGSSWSSGGGGWSSGDSGFSGGGGSFGGGGSSGSW